jgi:hypothetical protein
MSRRFPHHVTAMILLVGVLYIPGLGIDKETRSNLTGALVAMAFYATRRSYKRLEDKVIEDKKRAGEK